jgi:serine/threonine-protein kinase
MLVGKRYGPFTFEKEVGSGAMGTVYRARYDKTGQPVAIKVIATGMEKDETSLARFTREVEILRKLKHPNIVNVIKSGTLLGKPFYAMEFVDGESLESMLERKTRFTWEQVIQIGKQVCAGLHQAHLQSVVHRDLKPANIMMMRDGSVKLTDFGIAKALDQVQLTATNTTVGTAAYMSPEQCRGEKNLTPKSDLYSLGVMFYELLTGRRPFLAETTLDMFLAHVNGKFERPSRIVLDIPIWLDTLVCQLMEKDPQKRPLSAEVVGQALSEILDKVAAQRSAGVDMVSGRSSDRPRTENVHDAADIDAARHLKAATSRKRLRRRSKPFLQRTWVQAVGISSALALLGGLLYWASRPPSEETLFHRAEKLVASENPNDRDPARKAVQTFLDIYGDRDDDYVRQGRAWLDAIDLQKQETVLQNRIKINLPAEGKAESLARGALLAEDRGDLALASDKWGQLAASKEAKERPEHVWGLLGEKRLALIRDAESKEHELREELKRGRGADERPGPAESPRARALLALRYELFGDPKEAALRWKAVKDASADDPGDYSWLLLATKKSQENGRKHDVDLHKLLQQKLEAAAGQSDEEAHAAVQEIVELYGHEADVRPEVEKAKQILLKRFGEEASKKDDQGSGGF